MIDANDDLQTSVRLENESKTRRTEGKTGFSEEQIGIVDSHLHP
jgi:hypothetical protein